MASLAFPDVRFPAGAGRLRAEVRGFLAGEPAAGGFEVHGDSWLGGHSPAFSRPLGELAIEARPAGLWALVAREGRR